MLDYIPKKMLMMHWDGGGIERSREGDEDGFNESRLDVF
jgi:hypothetical protein